jgi:hypothetical protein
MKFSRVRDPKRLNRKIRGRAEKYRGDTAASGLRSKASTGSAILGGISRK